jgi:hypothetical protein
MLYFREVKYRDEQITPIDRVGGSLKSLRMLISTGNILSLFPNWFFKCIKNYCMK